MYIYYIYIYTLFLQFARSDSTFDLPWPAGSARDNGREDYVSLAGCVVQAEGRATTVPICSDRCAQTCKSYFLEFLLSFRIHLTSSHVGWSVFGWRPVWQGTAVRLYLNLWTFYIDCEFRASWACKQNRTLVLVWMTPWAQSSPRPDAVDTTSPPSFALSHWLQDFVDSRGPNAWSLGGLVPIGNWGVLWCSCQVFFLICALACIPSSTRNE